MNSNFFPREQQQNAARGSRPKLRSSAVSASSMVGRNSFRSLAGSILALAAPDIGFKKCCMRTGRYEGAPRNHYNR